MPPTEPVSGTNADAGVFGKTDSRARAKIKT
jgi:hypothetical protein